MKTILLIFVLFFVALTLKTTHEIDPNLLRSLISDRRLKTNINLLGKSPSGINIYSFNYLDDLETIYQGVMAQELIGTPFEKAVIHGEKFMAVNYDLIDVEFKEIGSNLAQNWSHPSKYTHFIK